MTELVLVVFTFTYLGMALGRVPGLRLDRSGIALMALAVLLVSGATTFANAVRHVDAPTLMLLFALMILSAQFQAARFYDWCAVRITESAASPSILLAVTVAVSGVLSAVLANDIVVYAMTPLICAGFLARGRDPRPYLLGLVGAANAGSAATVIGNPQNILIGQVGALDFWHFVAVCAPVAVFSLVAVYASVRIAWRAELAKTLRAAVAPMSGAPLDRWQLGKAIIATLALIAVLSMPIPRDLGALAIAAALLASRRLASRDMLSAVDWHLLVLFGALFAITGTLIDYEFGARAVAWLAAQGVSPERLTTLLPLALLASNTIGNVPAVVLITGLWPSLETGQLYGLALLSTLAGNLLLVGSIANLIVAERAAAAGVLLSFTDFARAGVPMTLVSLAAAGLWLALGGWMAW